MAPLERNLWAWLKDAREIIGPSLHLERVENVSTPGAPDVEGCLDGREFNCELKCAERPKRPTTGIRPRAPIRREQRDWWRKRVAAGGRVTILIQVGSGRQAMRYLLPVSAAPMLEERATEAELARVALAPGKSDKAALVTAMSHVSTFD